MFRQGHMFFEDWQEEPSKEDCRWDDATLDVNVDAGMGNLDIVTYKNHASQKPGHRPGDVIIKFQQAPHKFFKRSGDNLQVSIEISLRDSLLGWERRITHLDGHIVVISVQDVTKPGQVVRVQGEGMPLKDTPSQAGDLYVLVTVLFPARLSDVDKESISGSFDAIPLLRMAAPEALQPLSKPGKKSRDE